MWNCPQTVRIQVIIPGVVQRFTLKYTEKNVLIFSPKNQSTRKADTYVEESLEGVDSSLFKL